MCTNSKLVVIVFFLLRNEVRIGMCTNGGVGRYVIFLLRNEVRFGMCTSGGLGRYVIFFTTKRGPFQPLIYSGLTGPVSGLCGTPIRGPSREVWGSHCGKSGLVSGPVSAKS